MTTAERIEYIITEICHGSAKDFAMRTTINASAVTRLRQGTLGYGSQGIGPYFERIALAFPELDPHWLATGNGKPLGEGNTIDNLVREVRRLQKMVERMAKIK